MLHTTSVGVKDEVERGEEESGEVEALCTQSEQFSCQDNRVWRTERCYDLVLRVERSVAVSDMGTVDPLKDLYC